jgi:hypothetical protein
MPNTLTPIIRNMTATMRNVLAERAPLPSMVMTDFKADQAAVGQSVPVPFSPPVVGINRVPAATFTLGADRTVTATNISITNDQTFPFHMTGDDFLRMQQNPEFMPLSMTQAMRAWRNAVHLSIANLNTAAAGYYSTSTPSSGAAVGVAGTTPFGSDTSLITAAEKLLNDSLAPMEDRFLFIDTAAKQNLGNIGQLLRANEAGSDALLRRGIIGDLAGFNVVWGNDVRVGATIAGSGYLVNGTPAAGATTIPVDTGTGAIPAGTVIAFAADTTNRYVLATAYAGGAGNLTLTSGLVNAIADNNAITLSAGRRNMAFHREAIGLAIRLPALPDGGDAGEHVPVLDPETGIGVRFSTYKGYGANNYEISSAWGASVIRPELLKLILG